jgi:hypothetical protein
MSAEAPMRPLRFGVMCNGSVIAKWQADCLQELAGTGLAAPALLILNDAETVAPRPLGARILGAVTDSRLLWRLFRRSVMKRVAAVRPHDAAQLFAGVASIACKVERRGKFSEYFAPSDIDAIRAHDLDFIIRFGFGIVRGPVLEAARHGVWSYHHGDLEHYRGMPPGFWEVYRGDPVCGVTLQRLTDRLDGGIVLRRGFFKTIDKSYARSLANAMAASVDFPASVVRDIANGSAGYLAADASTTRAPIFHAPGNLEMLRFAGRLLGRRLKDLHGWLFRHAQWNIGIADAPIQSFLDEGFKPRIRWLEAPAPNRFFADPFAVETANGLMLLAEEYDFDAAKGHLSVMNWNEGSDPAAFKPMMNAPVHLSYPYTFEHGGEFYCVPEMSQARRIDLYRALVFPTQWERVATLIDDFDGVDATLFQHDGLWWMFCARSHKNQWIKLYAFHAEALQGPWRAHACNPLKSDVRSSRPAGTPFVHAGVLYRPAQDCSRAYGGAVSINRVDVLTPTRFSESVSRIFELDSAEPYSAGCHTLSAVGARTVLDGKRLMFQRSEFARELGSLFRRLLKRPA